MSRPSDAEREQHRAFLRSKSLHAIDKIGREEVFTGILAASLLNPTSRPVILKGLGLPTRLVLGAIYTAVEPVDLLLTGLDGRKQHHAVLIEVKWRLTNSHYPGWDTYPKDTPLRDWAPSQLDRAHQAVMSHLQHTPECPKCIYPQPCPIHGCRRCNIDPQAPEWSGYPKRYPNERRQAKALHAVLADVTAKAQRWHFRFLDYDDRDAADAFPNGHCNSAWTPARMSQLAHTARARYERATGRKDPDPALAQALQPLLQALYSN